uniref:ND5 intron 1 protein n=1 Tax=Cryphonectria parasitica TaxID=5116 RepID=Q8HHD0_CRYPA|nr:ND5 intron 1 protein [Cryphonectria parasitica]
MYLSIIILPVLGSIVAGFFGRKLGVRGAQIITCSCVIVTTILALLAWVEVGFNNIPVTINLFRWIDSEWFNIIWGFQFDSLTVFLVGILGVVQDTEAVLVLIQLYKNLVISSGRLQVELTLKGIKLNNFNLISLLVVTPSNIYILKSLKDLRNKLSSNFLQWFAGFTDAEGCFIIYPRLNKGWINYFQIFIHV